jgi:hypothetical protein
MKSEQSSIFKVLPSCILDCKLGRLYRYPIVALLPLFLAFILFLSDSQRLCKIENDLGSLKWHIHSNYVLTIM